MPKGPNQFRHPKYLWRKHKREYGSWGAMRDRCRNTRSKDYARWGGRGITICARWDKFEHFLKDMGERPPHTTLGRINGKLGYYAANCAWQTHREQQRNRGGNRHVRWRGRTQLLIEWAEELKLPYSLVLSRVYTMKWSINKTFTTPQRPTGFGARGSNCAFSRLSLRQVKAMRRAFVKGGVTYAALARRFSITPRAAMLVVTRQTWTWL